MKWVELLGCRVLYFVTTAGQMCVETCLHLWYGLRHWQSWTLVAKQFHLLGFRSLSIIVLCAAFVGAIITYQGYITLDQFGSTDGLSQLVALSLYRELSPVLTALLFAGRSASSVTAELVLMRSSDQLDAIKVMSGSVAGLILLPRYLAACVSMVMLVVVFNAVAIYASALVASTAFAMDFNAFLNQLNISVPFYPNMTLSIMKGLFFAIWIAIVMIHFGMQSEKTNQGIATGVTQTVVVSSIGVFIIDYIVTVLYPLGGSS